MLRLLDVLYILSFKVNLTNTIRLWRNKIGVYFAVSCPAELLFNRITFVYTNNIKDQFISCQSSQQSIFKITKSITNLKIWHS